MSCAGTLIKNARLRRGLTQAELAGLVQTHPTRISRLESGRERLGLRAAEVFSEVLRLNQAKVVREVLQWTLQQEGLTFQVSVRRGAPPNHACAAIRRTRLKRKLSLAQVALELGVSPPRVAEIERGDKLLTLASARNVGRVLELSERRVAQWVLQDAVTRECAARFVVSLR